MGVVSEAAAAVDEKALTSKPLRIKILTKKPVISACEFSKQVHVMNSMEKLVSTGNTTINVSGNKKLNSSILGTKRKLEGGVECVKEKRLKMDRYATSNCKVILGKLLKHRFSFPFKRPVDPVELRIPDYFDIIKNPMDLGTIKQKLDDNKYRDAEAFESDVRLTFSNAMMYNPPENFVHKHANELMTFFDHLWKPVKVKMNRQFGGIEQPGSQKITDETTHNANRKCLENFSSHAVKLARQTIFYNERDPGERTEVSIKKKVKKAVKHCENMKQLNLQKIEESTHDVSQNYLKGLSSHVHKLPGQTMLSNGKHCEELTVKREQRHCGSMKQLNSQKIVDETMHNASRKCPKSSVSHVNKLPAKTILSSVEDSQELMEASMKKKVDMGGKKDVKDAKAKGSASAQICRSVTDNGSENSESLHARPVYSVVKMKCVNAKESMEERKVPHNELKVVEVEKSSLPQPSISDQNCYGHMVCLDEEHACSTSGDATIEGLETVLDIQLSPTKALRAAMLKSRFADTILKAQHKTLLQSGGGTDSVKLQQEKERLERKQRQEKAKIEAQIRAAESAARIKAESELKKRRKQERIALEKMEQSVDLDDNFHVLRELEALIGRPLFVLCKCRDGRSQAAYLWDQIEPDELRSPLEQLGLFIKAEYLAGDDDEAVEEEGEWEEGEVVF